MENEINQNYLNNDYIESSKNYFSNSDCYINNNPISIYMNLDSSFQNDKRDTLKRRTRKNHQFCNLNDPKLIDAYNEGYYGFNNVPKQYYIYPKFSRKEYKRKSDYIQEPINEYRLNEIINKENENNINNDNKIEISNKDLSYNNDNHIINNEQFVYSYINYPYPKLINISSNIFGSLHNMKSNYSILNQNLFNNNKKIEMNQNVSDINNEIDNLNNNIDEEEGNFYFINNNITSRNVPFPNTPDDISIDDEQEEEIQSEL